MILKIKFNDKEKHILYNILTAVLSISFMTTGIYAISYLQVLEVIKGQTQIVCVLGLHILQWWLVMRAVFKYYHKPTN
jgi:hypothetical protein